MGNEGFLRRWSRLKAHGGGAEAHEHEPEAAPLPGASMQYAGAGQTLDLPALADAESHPPYAPPAPAAAPRRQPTLDDVDKLGPDSDFSAFVSQGVDKTVQRLAMKKLFSDPHFNIMDGLDVYIDDYNKSDPIPPAMMASLNHARSVFARMLDNKPAGEGDAAPPPSPGQPEPPPQQDDA